MRINVRIERLILDGLPVERRDGAAVQAALEAKLTQLFNSGELARGLRSSSMLPSLRAVSIELTESENPMEIGQKIAQAVHRSLGEV